MHFDDRAIVNPDMHGAMLNSLSQLVKRRGGMEVFQDNRTARQRLVRSTSSDVDCVVVNFVMVIRTGFFSLCEDSMSRSQQSPHSNQLQTEKAQVVVGSNFGASLPVQVRL